MNSSFAEAVDAWGPFFSAVAGAAATLVGLLFVALALNPTVMADSGPAGLRVWAGQSFHSFLMVLVVSLVALIPDETPVAIAITLGIVGTTGFLGVVRSVRRARTDPDPDWHTRHALLRFLSPALAYLVCLWAAAEAWQGDPDALNWIVAVVFLLTLSASARSWDLLKAMGVRMSDEARALATTARD